MAVCKYALGVNAGRIEDPGKDGVSRKEKGYKDGVEEESEESREGSTEGCSTTSGR